MFYPVGPKFELPLHQECSEAGKCLPAPWLCAAVTQHSGLSSLWELVVPQLSSDSLNLSREPTPVSCVFNLSVEPESQRQLPVSVPVSQTQTMLQLLLGSSRSPLPG